MAHSMNNGISSLEKNVLQVASVLSAKERLVLFNKLSPVVAMGMSDTSVDIIYSACVSQMQLLNELPLDFIDFKTAFFKPIQRFLINKQPIAKIEARIFDQHLQPIWVWICRDLMPEFIQKNASIYLKLISSNDTEGAAKIADNVYEKLFEAIEPVFLKINDSEIEFNKLSAQLGSEIILQDLQDLIQILRNRAFIEVLSQNIEAHKEAITDKFVSQIKKDALQNNLWFPLLASICAQLQFSYNPNPYFLLRYMYSHQQELTFSSVLQSNEFIPCLDLLLSELEFYYSDIKMLTKHKSAPETVLVEVKAYYALAKFLNSEIEFSKKDRLGARFLDVRSKMTNLLKHELEELSPQISGVFRAIMSKTTDHLNDERFENINNILYMLDIFNEVRIMGSEIALNDFFVNLKINIDKSFDVCMNSLIDRNDISDKDSIDKYNFYTETLLTIANALYDQEFVEALRKSFSTISQSRLAKIG